MKKLLPAILIANLAISSLAADPLTAPIECQDCSLWNQREPPVHLHGGSYYVGVASAAEAALDRRLVQEAPPR